MISVVSTCNSNGIARVPGADAGFRVRGGAPVAYPGFQRGGCLWSAPIQKVVVGGWGVVHFRSDIREVGGGGGGGGGGSLVPRLLFPQLRMDYITATWKE